MMLLISLIGNAVSVKARNTITKVVPYVVIFVGAIFIFRGLCLGIPYLSPSKAKLEMTMQMKPADACGKPKTSSAPCCHSK
jgi:uncharacterized protein